MKTLLRFILPATAALALVACATLPHATLLDAQRAEKQWPGTTVAQLEAGRQAYVARCSGCHNLHLPEEKPPEAWPDTVAEMEKEARLQPGERELIERYLMTLSFARSLPRDEKGRTGPLATRIVRSAH